ncbi:hypothetical protein EZS27_033108 [termite gut metagenome]|uniref:CDP-alcohol phosphatidyltransferase n=1 Tax=termite gut metagenome TaxID=433724 RepID=A0A5J4Q4E6_9ZZZZ
MSQKKLKPSLESTLKSADTEETIDLLFYRPIGYRWALFFNKFDISPNMVTIVSIFLGVGAGIMFYFDNLIYNSIGIFLLVWANTYDSADGQLARMSGKKSEIGRVLDGLAGDFWFFSIYFFICLRLYSEWSYGIWIMAALSGFSHGKQAAMADYYRNIHLFFLKGKSGSEMERSESQQALFHSLPWKGNIIGKLYHYLYGNYTVSQEKLSPKFQRFFTLMRKCYGEEIPQPLADAFRKASKPLMKYTNILSFNTRVIVLFIGIFTGKPWIYFVFELTVLNGLLTYMIIRHETFSNRFYFQLQKQSGCEE